MLRTITLASALALAAFAASAQVGPVVPTYPCDQTTTTINARVSITKEQVQIGPDEYIQTYYEGWNGNCWNATQDAFDLGPVGNQAVTFSITIYDPQGLNIRFTDADQNYGSPNAAKAVVFGTMNGKGRVNVPLSTWPIPGLSPNEQNEFSNFGFSPDYTTLTFTDRDNTRRDYHFGVWLVDPVGNNGSEYSFVSDPGRDGKGVGDK
ncbi:MAG TPA: hypothetical protein PKM48_04435 [Parvularculaceae bacterium]|nr:hypothetical protein [Parvularculaceae bacterium]HNS86550.1 hypothetical protein [Parvularculaceae bacterium]